MQNNGIDKNYLSDDFAIAYIRFVYMYLYSKTKIQNIYKNVDFDV
jgi:hypothetical protein